MAKRKVLKITPILVTLNILVLFGIAGFYTYRLVKYYKLQNGNKDEVALLADTIIKKRSFLDETTGLVLNEEDNTYRYKGEVKDNYIYYSGMYYRILGIDKDGNVRAISEENVTLMYPGFDNGYKDSYINKWLNSSETKNSGIFESALYGSDSLIVKSYFCSDSVSDAENITCDDNTTDYKITLLSLYDYKEAGGKSSFLNNGKEFSLGTLDDKNNAYYVTESGEISQHQRQNIAVLIRPVITIKGDSELKDGNGSLDKPYIIEKHEVEVLSDAYVGSYVSINDELYRIVNILEDKVLIVKSDVLMENEKEVLRKFDGEDNIYNPSVGIGKYLNKTYLNTLSFKDNLVKGDFYTGLLSLDSYDYAKVKDSSVKAKIGMLTMGDMFINEKYNVLTTLRGIEATDIIYVLSENGYFFGDTLTSKYTVRPALYLKDDIEITEGNGTKEDAYILKIEEPKEETKTENKVEE